MQKSLGVFATLLGPAFLGLLQLSWARATVVDDDASDDACMLARPRSVALQREATSATCPALKSGQKGLPTCYKGMPPGACPGYVALPRCPWVCPQNVSTVLVCPAPQCPQPQKGAGGGAACDHVNVFNCPGWPQGEGCPAKQDMSCRCSAPPPPRPVTVTLKNSEKAAGVIICTAQGWSGVRYNGAAVTTLPCSAGGAGKVCLEGNSRRLVMHVAVGGTVVLQIAAVADIEGGRCWFQEAAAYRKKAMTAAQMVTVGEFTIIHTVVSADGSRSIVPGKVSLDISHVNGVSGGMVMQYKNHLNQIHGNVASIPKAPTNKKALPIGSDKAYGYCAVLSDQAHWGAGGAIVTEMCDCDFDPKKDDPSIFETKPKCKTASSGCKKLCPAPMANHALGQHQCRVFYADSYKKVDGYCRWLRDEKAQAYCWAMDELTCTDDKCGWGGQHQPTGYAQVEQTAPDVSKAANPEAREKMLGDWAAHYSCGSAEQPGVGVQWWVDAASLGCVDKAVQGQGTNPQPVRMGGDLLIEFKHLAWLTC